MEFKNNGEFIEVYDYCYYKGDDILFGSIRKGEDNHSVFHPARKVILTFKHLKLIAKEISRLNINAKG